MPEFYRTGLHRLDTVEIDRSVQSGKIEMKDTDFRRHVSLSLYTFSSISFKSGAIHLYT